MNVLQQLPEQSAASPVFSPGTKEATVENGTSGYTGAAKVIGIGSHGCFNGCVASGKLPVLKANVVPEVDAGDAYRGLSNLLKASKPVSLQ